MFEMGPRCKFLLITHYIWWQAVWNNMKGNTGLLLDESVAIHVSFLSMEKVWDMQ